MTHTYDWTELTDKSRFPRARATTAEKLLASLDRLAALAEEPEECGVWDQLFRAERRAKEYEGLTRREAEQQARTNGVQHFRIVDRDIPGGLALTADLRTDRLNLLIHDGRVARAAFG